jgi:hypothetical protein
MISGVPISATSQHITMQLNQVKRAKLTESAIKEIATQKDIVIIDYK